MPMCSNSVSHSGPCELGHEWSADEHEGVKSRNCHRCGDWELEVELATYRAMIRSLNELINDAKRERDEARAELNRLKSGLL